MHYMPQTENFNVHRLIDFLISNKEVDLYYYLLNQVSIVKFSLDSVELSSASNKDYNARLENIIAKLTGKSTKIIISGTKGISLKSKLMDDLSSSKIWVNLVQSFPGCEILDIIHKNG